MFRLPFMCVQEGSDRESKVIVTLGAIAIFCELPPAAALTVTQAAYLAGLWRPAATLIFAIGA